MWYSLLNLIFFYDEKITNQQNCHLKRPHQEEVEVHHKKKKIIANFYTLILIYLFIYECLPRIVSSALMNCYQWGSCLPCETPTKEPLYDNKIFEKKIYMFYMLFPNYLFLPCAFPFCQKCYISNKHPFLGGWGDIERGASI